MRRASMHARWAAVLAAGMLLVGAAGCGPSRGDGQEPGPSTSASPTQTGYGTRYVLPAALCDVVDLAPLKEAYPQDDPDDPLHLSVFDHCDTTLRNGSRGLSLNVSAHVTEDGPLRVDPTIPRQTFEGQRARAEFPPTTVDGVGSGAFVYTDGVNRMWLEAYDGNLNLRLFLFTHSTGDPLDPATADRLGRVARGILVALTP